MEIQSITDIFIFSHKEPRGKESLPGFHLPRPIPTGIPA